VNPQRQHPEQSVCTPNSIFQGNKQVTRTQQQTTQRKKYRGPKFKKSLGQNFLRDVDIAYRIAKSLPTDKLVLEIGPGDGFLTEKLLETGHRIIGVEIDIEWMSKLQSRLKHHRGFKLVIGDFLDLDWETLNQEADEIVVTGNLPYHLASPTLFAMFRLVRDEVRPAIRQMVIMIQREVGARITAEPNCKEYGSLTLLTRYHALTEYLFTVPSSCFMPRPRVDGAVVRLTFRDPDNFPNVNYEIFRRFVRGCFAQRRKMMRNSLNVINDLPDGWRDLNYDFTRRPEQFTFQEYITLIKDLQNLQIK